MKSVFGICLLSALFCSFAGFAQVGEKVEDVKVLNMSNDTVSLPWFGQKNILIFYADPAHPGQNKDFRNYFKSHPVSGPEIASYGIINLAAAPLIPNSLIRRKVKKEIAGTNAQIYLDPDQILSTAWDLSGADNNFAIIFVNKNKIIEFYKAGQMTAREQTDLLELMKKYSDEPSR